MFVLGCLWAADGNVAPFMNNNYFFPSPLDPSDRSEGSPAGFNPHSPQNLIQFNHFVFVYHVGLLDFMINLRNDLFVKWQYVCVLWYTRHNGAFFINLARHYYRIIHYFYVQIIIINYVVVSWQLEVTWRNSSAVSQPKLSRKAVECMTSFEQRESLLKRRLIHVKRLNLWFLGCTFLSSAPQQRCCAANVLY